MFSVWNTFTTLRQVRNFTCSAALLARSHYDSLGISPKATQTDVKSAYYKLSMLYHPDKNEGSDDAADKFREVSEAYEVLGNVKLRRLYDKGVHTVKSSTVSGSYQHKDFRTARPAPPTGRSPIYDFDEWSRAHYGYTFARDMENKRRTAFRARKTQVDQNDVKTEKFMLAVMILLALCMYLSYEDLDEVRTGNTVPSKIPKD